MVVKSPPAYTTLPWIPRVRTILYELGSRAVTFEAVQGEGDDGRGEQTLRQVTGSHDHGAAVSPEA